MAKKTFKEKEQAFLTSNKAASSEATKETYVPQKRIQDEALEMLKKKEFDVFFHDSILYCKCADNEEYERYGSILAEHFGKDGKVAFSFGATIKSYKESGKEERE